MTTTELKSIAEDAEKWREHQNRVRTLDGWDAEQWAAALEWYQPHTPIAPTSYLQAMQIKDAYLTRFGREPAKVATALFQFVEHELGIHKVFTPWYSRP
jgi:hypothetical protein